MTSLNVLETTLTENVFQTQSGVPLLVACNCPIGACNYRCHYCYLDHEGRNRKAEREAFARWEKVLERVVAIPRPLILAIGTSGEPLVIPPFWEVLRRLSPLPNVRAFWFPTNLSRPIEPLLAGIDVGKIGITASLHPSQFKDPQQELDLFLQRGRWLYEHGGDVVVNFILTPDQIPFYWKYHQVVSSAGLDMTANVFRGEYLGLPYPESYTQPQREIIEEILGDELFVLEYMSGKDCFGMPCTAGRDAITVELDGTVYNCPFAREKLGSIFDPDFSIYAENGRCTTNWCKCHWSIGLMEPIVARYRRTRNIFRFERRLPGERGEHAFI